MRSLKKTSDPRPEAAGDPGAAATRPLFAAGLGPARDGPGHPLSARPGASGGGAASGADSRTGPRRGFFWLSPYHRGASAAGLAGQPQAGVSLVSGAGVAKNRLKKRAGGARVA